MDSAALDRLDNNLAKMQEMGASKDEMREYYALATAQFADQQPEPVGAVEDSIRSTGGGLARGAAGMAMWLPNLANEAVAGPQYLYEGLIGEDRKDFQPVRPFYSSTDALAALPKDLQPYEPKTGYGVAADFVGQLGGNIAGGKAIQAAPGLTRKAANSEFVKTERSGGPTAAEKAAAFSAKVAKSEARLNEPLPLYEKMLDNYGTVKDLNDINYTNLSNISDKTPTVDLSGLRSHINSEITNLKGMANASPESQESLTFFKKLANTIDSRNGKGSISDLVDVKKYLNSRYKPKFVGTERKLAESELSSLVNGKLNNYGKANPDWNATYRQADDFFMNNIAPFRGKVAEGIGFSPADAREIAAFRSGQLRELSPELANKVRDMPNKIITSVDYKTVAQLLPKEDQAQFAKLTADAIKSRRGISASAGRHEDAARTAAYSLGAVTSGSPYMKARAAGSALDFFRAKDPIFDYMKNGVSPLMEKIQPDVIRAQQLAMQIKGKTPAGQKALPYYEKGFSPAEAKTKYVESLAAKRAEELAPSQIGQERATFEAAQAKAADMARMMEQQKIMEAESGLAARQAGVSPQQYAKFLEQQTPPVVAQPPVAPQPNVLYNPQEMAEKALNQARGAGQTMNNPAFTNEDIVNELMKLRLYGKRK